MRILSYNIHKGFSSGNVKFILHEIKEAVTLVNADVVFLQEVLGHHEKHKSRLKHWPTVPQFEFLADKLWPHFAYGKNAIYSKGHHGNVILSKHPFSFWENVDVSNFMESRGLLHGAIHIPHCAQPIHLVCVHLSLFNITRLKQISKLSDRLMKTVPRPSPLIIAGDFNDWSSKATAPLKKTLHVKESFEVYQGQHVKTFPSWFPVLPLDRVYFRGFKVIDAQCLTGAPWNRLSDHSALYVDLEPI